jgi:hypothetical protein
MLLCDPTNTRSLDFTSYRCVVTCCKHIECAFEIYSNCWAARCGARLMSSSCCLVIITESYNAVTNGAAT